MRPAGPTVEDEVELPVDDDRTISALAPPTADAGNRQK